MSTGQEQVDTAKSISTEISSSSAYSKLMSFIDDIKGADLGLNSQEKRFRDNKQFFQELIALETYSKKIEEIILLHLQAIREYYEHLSEFYKSYAGEPFLNDLMKLDGVMQNVVLANQLKDMFKELQELENKVLESTRDAVGALDSLFAAVKSGKDAEVADGVMLHKLLDEVHPEIVAEVEAGKLSPDNFEERFHEVVKGVLISKYDKKEGDAEKGAYNTVAVAKSHVPEFGALIKKVDVQAKNIVKRDDWSQKINVIMNDRSAVSEIKFNRENKVGVNNFMDDVERRFMTRNQISSPPANEKRFHPSAIKVEVQSEGLSQQLPSKKA